jgi:hypothetical protein
MSRLVCACGTPISAARAGSEHCSTGCETVEHDRQRTAAAQRLMEDSVDRFAEWYGQQRAKELQTGPAAGMMLLLQSEPTLLDPAPAEAGAEDIDRRRLDEVHACLRCGKRAQVAYVADLKEAGNRWLDFCAACDSWLRRELY